MKKLPPQTIHNLLCAIKHYSVKSYVYKSVVFCIGQNPERSIALKSIVKCFIHALFTQTKFDNRLNFNPI